MREKEEESNSNQKSHLIIPVSSEIDQIKGRDIWNSLSNEEQKYACHMSRAAWEGQKLCYFRNSFESPALFVLF